MNLREFESQTWVSPFKPVAEATALPEEQAVFGGLSYFIFDNAEATASLPVALSGRAGTKVVVAGPFTVGFRPQGGETALFRTAADFALEPLVKAVEADRQRIQMEKNRRAVALLESWLDVDEETQAEHRETLDYLVRTLDEDRTSSRKLFP